MTKFRLAKALSLVGERGPEIANAGHGARIHDAKEAKELLRHQVHLVLEGAQLGLGCREVQVRDHGAAKSSVRRVVRIEDLDLLDVVCHERLGTALADDEVHGGGG